MRATKRPIVDIVLCSSIFLILARLVSGSFGPSRVPITSAVNIRSKSNALSSSKHQISDSTLRKKRNFAKSSLESEIHLTRAGGGGGEESKTIHFSRINVLLEFRE